MSKTLDGADTATILDALRALKEEVKLLRENRKILSRDLLGVEELAARLSLSPKSVRNQLSLGIFPIRSHLICGRRVFRRADVDAFVKGLADE